MIRNVIKATLFFAVVVSASSVAQIASALDLRLGEFSSLDSHHPSAWTPGRAHQQSSQYFSNMVKPATWQGSATNKAQRKFSLELYQGDGLDDLRQKSEYYDLDLLPEEDTEAYGFSVKQRF